MDSQLGNKPAVQKRKPSAGQPAVTEKTASWPGLPGKSGPNRSAGVTKLKIHARSEGL
jgi:hypothetical protein